MLGKASVCSFWIWGILLWNPSFLCKQHEWCWNLNLMRRVRPLGRYVNTFFSLFLCCSPAFSTDGEENLADLSSNAVAHSESEVRRSQQEILRLVQILLLICDPGILSECQVVKRWYWKAGRTAVMQNELQLFASTKLRPRGPCQCSPAVLLLALVLWLYITMMVRGNGKRWSWPKNLFPSSGSSWRRGNTGPRVPGISGDYVDPPSQSD